MLSSCYTYIHINIHMYIQTLGDLGVTISCFTFWLGNYVQSSYDSSVCNVCSHWSRVGSPTFCYSSASTKDCPDANTTLFAAMIRGSWDQQLLMVPVWGRKAGCIFAIDCNVQARHLQQQLQLLSVASLTYTRIISNRRPWFLAAVAAIQGGVSTQSSFHGGP